MPSEIKIGDELVSRYDSKGVDVRKPLAVYTTLNNETPAEYLENSQYGDAALDAILNGRNILIRIPSRSEVTYPPDVSNEKHTALFSPVIHYQLPNHDNGFLYLYYLRDERQTIDLSAVGMGTISMPIYGELKLKLSREYNTCPVEHKNTQELIDLFTRTLD